MPNEDTPEEGGKTFTQADLDRLLEDRLARERKKYSDYDELKAKAQQLEQLEQGTKSEVEKLTERLAEAEKRATAEAARADRFEVALDKGLDMTRAKRLTGATREELEADAEELQTWQSGSTEKPAPSKPTESLSGGGDPTEDPPVDMRQVVDSIPRGF